MQRTDQQREVTLSPFAARQIDRMVPVLRDISRPIALATTRTTLGPVDLIAVERAVNGTADPARLTTAEAQAAARVLLTLDAHLATIATRTGLPEKRLLRGDPECALALLPVRPRRTQTGAVAA